jgi:hypothetical protein
MSITAIQYLNNKNNDKSFVGVFHYSRPIRSKHDSYTEIYGLLSVSSEVDIPGQRIAKFAWDGIVDGFEYSKKDSVNEALKTSLTEATRRVKQLIANDASLLGHGVDINFSVFVSSEQGVYVGVLGDTDIYIYKKGRIVDVFEMLSSKKAKTAGIVLDSEDVLFTSSHTLLKRNIKSLTNLGCGKEVVDTFDNVAYDLKVNEGLLVLCKEKDEKKVESKVVEEKQKVELVEPSNTDYIPTEKEVKEDITVKKEKDLKDVFSPLTGHIKSIGKGVGSKVTPVKTKVRSTLNNVKLKAPKVELFSKLIEKFGKKRWFKKVSAKVSQSDIGARGRESLKGFKIDGYKEKSKKVQRFKLFFIVFLSIALIVGGVKFTMDQAEARRVSKEANSIFTLVDSYVSSAEESSKTDKDSTLMSIFKATEELGKLPSNLSEKDMDKQTELKNRLLTLEDDLYKRVAIKNSDTSIESYLDTRLAFGENSKPSDITIHQDGRANEFLYVTDSGLKGVFRVSLYNKEVRRLPDNDGLLQEPAMIYTGRSGIFVLDLRVGVLRAKFTEDGWFESFQKLTGLGIENIGANDIAEFAVLTETDNVYVLDREKKSLLKSTNFGTGYGLSFSYIKDEEFANANEILADLSVYILTSGPNGLNRFNYNPATQGQIPAPVTVVGVDGEFKNLAYGYTKGDLDYDLYLFDSVDKRFLRFSKPREGGGEIRHPNQVVLKNQYVYRGDRGNTWENVNDFVVVNSQKFMYVLDSSTIWKVRL